MTTDRNAVDANRSEHPSEPRPTTPLGDDIAAAGDLVNFVLDRCLELADALDRYATLRFEEAPISSRNTVELASTIAAEVTSWVRRWPV
ncbi:hypothetical protein ACIBCN_19910 [Nocardia sp. NPDC051052]|uniref:hypothetical protein n=1 Tax=Nocardia sp. NPDC051052 TaxID=3364322 RepID=UPI00378DE35B